MLDIEAFGELVRTRRTIRGFQGGKDVPEEAIQKILDIARWSPSAGNGQPWEFIVIRDPEMRQRIVDLFVKQSEQKLEIERVVRRKSRLTAATGFRKAPVFLLVVGDPRVNDAYPIRTREEKGNQHYISGLASTVLVIHLAAKVLGLGSQWVSDANSPYMGSMLKAWLGIPDPLKIYELIPIGYPVGQPPGRGRRPLEEIVHHERYDPAKARTDEDIKKFIASATVQSGHRRPEADGSGETEVADN